MLSSTLCAEVSIDVTEAVKAKNTWAINKIFKFSGPPQLAKMFPNKLGEIYLQVKYKIVERGCWKRARRR